MRTLTLGIVANEFFDPARGRMGGFGWAVSRTARLFAEDPTLGVRPTIVCGDRVGGSTPAVSVVHGVPFVAPTWNRWASARCLRDQRIDLLLAIDFRPSYRWVLAALPEVPVILWVRDPRPPEAVERIALLRLPDDRRVTPLGIEPVDCTGAGREFRRSCRRGRPFHVAVTDPALVSNLPGTYGVQPERVWTLPNPLPAAPDRVEKACAPRVAFLGRLDPVKRPWVFVELARRLPDVEFVMLGQSHFTGPGSWRPVDVPANLRLVGQADGPAKHEWLASSWLLVNTSVHEALAISLLEGLAYETPMVSMVDPCGVAARFGAAVGPEPGTGLDGLDRLTHAVRRLLDDRTLRERLGREGRAWVERHHGRQPFLDAFGRLTVECGLR